MACALGVFGTTLVAFFLAEMGDKTQIATVMLAAQYNAYLWVVAGTTLGMIANAPVVWLGDKIRKKVPIRAHGASDLGSDLPGAGPAGHFGPLIQSGDGNTRPVKPAALLVYLPNAPICHSLRALYKSS